MPLLEIDPENDYVRDFLDTIAPTDEEMQTMGFTKREIQRVFYYGHDDLEVRRSYWLTAQATVVSIRKLTEENEIPPTWTQVKMSAQAFLYKHHKEINSSFFDRIKRDLIAGGIAERLDQDRYRITVPMGKLNRRRNNR